MAEGRVRVKVIAWFLGSTYRCWALGSVEWASVDPEGTVKEEGN